MAKLLAKNTKFEISTGTGTWTKVSGVKSFSGLHGGAASVIDTSDLDSVAKEKLAGLPDEGSLTLGLDLIPTDPGQQAIDAARLTGAPTGFRITYSTLDRFTFNVLVLSNEVSGQVDQIITTSAKLEISGAVTKDQATS